jgi:hypothetical protein
MFRRHRQLLTSYTGQTLVSKQRVDVLSGPVLRCLVSCKLGSPAPQISGALTVRRMQKAFLMMGVVFGGLLSSFAQNVEGVSAPADIVLELQIEGNAHQFHLGEAIPSSSPIVRRFPADIFGLTKVASWLEDARLKFCARLRSNASLRTGGCLATPLSAKC